jgi:hypothetical protein
MQTLLASLRGLPIIPKGIGLQRVSGMKSLNYIARH